MSTYSSSQLERYLARIQLPLISTSDASLAFLTTLQKAQLTHIPFESLALHYSTTRSISLDPADLFEKIVTHGRGGYCLENNTFFKVILQSLGFTVTSVVCRINNSSRGIYDGGWRAMSHMANLVRIGDERYLVDVGYGADGPCHPVPLISDKVVDGLPAQTLKLEHKTLLQHTDDSQRVWIYSQRRIPGGWAEVYHFIDAEMFAPDFDVLNHFNMLHSFFAQNIVVQRFFDGESPQRGLQGSYLLVRDTFKVRVGNEDKVVRQLESEEERLAVLEKHFGIRLTEDQCRAIHGWPGQLRLPIAVDVTV